MNQDDMYMRDIFAVFAMQSLMYIWPDEGSSFVAEIAYEYANDMMEARKPKEELGIVKARRKKND